MMNIMLVGSGGREHALAWKLAQSERCSKLILVPGNDAIQVKEFSRIKVERWDLPAPNGRSSFQILAERAHNAGVDLAIIGPEQPLSEGLTDALQEAGVLTFGPTKRASQLEWSKSFAKEVMRAARVPTAEYHLSQNLADAENWIGQAPWPIVVKADGLALGKGVIVCDSVEQGLEAARALFPISKKLVIEQRVHGEEVSCMAFCDGERAVLFEPARDFKRLKDRGLGPNTGGMGAYCPVPEVSTPEWKKRILEEVFLPTLKEMKKRGTEFRGLLYAGLMVDVKASKLWVIEFNARFGDPEAQVLLARFKGDLIEWCMAAAEGRLGDLPPTLPEVPGSAVIVVGAAPGYPEKPEKGIRIAEASRVIENLDLLSTAPECFVSGLRKVGEGQWEVSGGRVLGALGVGRNLEEARSQAYYNLERVKFPRMQFRTDIAERAPS